MREQFVLNNLSNEFEDTDELSNSTRLVGEKNISSLQKAGLWAVGLMTAANILTACKVEVKTYFPLDTDSLRKCWGEMSPQEQRAYNEENPLLSAMTQDELRNSALQICNPNLAGNPSPNP